MSTETLTRRSLLVGAAAGAALVSAGPLAKVVAASPDPSWFIILGEAPVYRIKLVASDQE